VSFVHYIELQNFLNAPRTLKHCEQANRQNFYVWNSHRQHGARIYSRQRRTSGFLSNSWATC